MYSPFPSTNMRIARHSLVFFVLFFAHHILRADAAGPVTTIWIEGENPTVNKMNRHPWWYDQVKRDQLSGGDFISNWSKDKPGEAGYKFTAAKAGEYEFWVRANPVQSKLSYALNRGADTPI